MMLRRTIKGGEAICICGTRIFAHIGQREVQSILFGGGGKTSGIQFFYRSGSRNMNRTGIDKRIVASGTIHRRCTQR